MLSWQILIFLFSCWNTGVFCLADECTELVYNATILNGGSSDFCSDSYEFYDDNCKEFDNGNDDGASLSKCCSEVKQSYLDRCDDEEDDLLSIRSIMSASLVSFAGFLVRALIRRYKVGVSEAAAITLVGILAGVIMRESTWKEVTLDKQLLLSVFLPPIILEATLMIDKPNLRIYLFPVTLLSIFGSVVSCFVTGYLVFFLSSISSNPLPAVESLLFGCLISVTDPAATFALFNSLSISYDKYAHLRVIGFGEAVLGSAAAISLFLAVRESLYSNNPYGDMNADFVGATVGKFFAVLIGSAFVGLVGGLLSVAFFTVFPIKADARMEVVSFFLFALIPYYTADGLEWSGVIALVVCGLIMDFRVRDMLSPLARRHLVFTVQSISVLFETVLFVLLGMFMVYSEYSWSGSLITIGLVCTFIGRAVATFPLSFLVNRTWGPVTRVFINERSNDESNQDWDESMLEEEEEATSGSTGNNKRKKRSRGKISAQQVISVDTQERIASNDSSASRPSSQGVGTLLNWIDGASYPQSNKTKSDQLSSNALNESVRSKHSQITKSLLQDIDYSSSDPIPNSNSGSISPNRSIVLQDPNCDVHCAGSAVCVSLNSNSDLNQRADSQNSPTRQLESLHSDQSSALRIKVPDDRLNSLDRAISGKDNRMSEDDEEAKKKNTLLGAVAACFAFLPTITWHSNISSKNSLLPLKLSTALWYSGTKGILSFVLVENIGKYDTILDEGSKHVSELLAMTTAVLLFSIFIMSGGAEFVFQSLGVVKSSKINEIQVPDISDTTANVNQNRSIHIEGSLEGKDV